MVKNKRFISVLDFFMTMALVDIIKKHLKSVVLGAAVVAGASGFLAYRHYRAPETALAKSISGCDGVSAIVEEPVREVVKNKNADFYFDEFPVCIPGASSVEKHYVPGAKYCLVHIRQVHRARNDEAFLPKIKSVQSDIYEILSFMIDKMGVKEVYAEGMTERTVDLYESARDSRLRIIQSCFENGMEIPSGLEISEEYNAVKRLFNEGRINLKAAEDLAINDQSYHDYDALFRGREHFALEVIAKNPVNLMPVLVYGAKHDWLDNVADWNKLHPDEKFSLIVVTPESYKN